MTSPSKRNTMFGGVAFVYTIIFFENTPGRSFGLNVTVTTPLSPGGFPVPFGSGATTRGFYKFYQQGSFPFVCKFKFVSYFSPVFLHESHVERGLFERDLGPLAQ